MIILIRVRQIKLSLDEDNMDNLKKKVLKKLNLKDKDILSFNITKRSIDARRDLKIIYEVEIETNKKVKTTKDIEEVEKVKYIFPKGNINRKILIVGAGPAGLFSAYFLSKNGYNPVIIDRGFKIEDRVKAVDKFFKDNIINEKNNTLFGEGGAGTFSDGKLNTLVKDKRGLIKEVLEIFVSCGAPKEILYEKNPHIGTDVLRKVIVNLRNKIIEYGGVFKYNSHLDDLIIENNTFKGAIINNEKYYFDDIILAIGHSARDTFKMLYENNIDMNSKPFAVGLRIIHNQSIIDKNQYGKYYKLLKPASYKLTYTTKSKRGVYSFCMCPGGYVINSSNEKGMLLVNGMSNYKRDSGFANSAILVTINDKDYGKDIFDGMYFQEKLEKKAYEIGKGYIPVQYFNDYKNNCLENTSNKYINAFKGCYNFSNLNDIFPDFINESLKEGIKNFNNIIPGFNEGLLAGVESRSSSPVRIIRDATFNSNIKNVYPAGEGSGYSGGITTSAIDGIKVAEALVLNNSK